MSTTRHVIVEIENRGCIGYYLVGFKYKEWHFQVNSTNARVWTVQEFHHTHLDECGIMIKNIECKLDEGTWKKDEGETLQIFIILKLM